MASYNPRTTLARCLSSAVKIPLEISPHIELQMHTEITKRLLHNGIHVKNIIIFGLLLLQPGWLFSAASEKDTVEIIEERDLEEFADQEYQPRPGSKFTGKVIIFREFELRDPRPGWGRIVVTNGTYHLRRLFMDGKPENISNDRPIASLLQKGIQLRIRIADPDALNAMRRHDSTLAFFDQEIVQSLSIP